MNPATEIRQVGAAGLLDKMIKRDEIDRYCKNGHDFIDDDAVSYLRVLAARSSRSRSPSRRFQAPKWPRSSR